MRVQNTLAYYSTEILTTVKILFYRPPEMSRLSFYDCTFQSKLAGQILQKFVAVIYATVAVNPCNLRIKSFITYTPGVEMYCIFFLRQKARSFVSTDPL